MKEKELRKLSRRELLELLLEMSTANGEMRLRISEMEAELEKKQIVAERCGSIAAAALEINHVFEAADAAAKQYVESVRMLSEGSMIEQLEREAREKSDELIARTETLCRQKLEDADRCCRDWRQKTSEECKAMEREAEKKYAEAERYWTLAAKQAARFGKISNEK